MSKLTKFSLGMVVFGLLLVGLMFVYYGLHLGIKPCQGVPSDARNCGEADIGGVYFIVAGGPVAFIGLILLMISMLRDYIRRNKQ